MTTDWTQDARIRELLRVADDAWRMLSTGHAAPGLAEALEGVYRDIGKHIHTSHRARLAGPAHDAAETQEVPARGSWPRVDPLDGTTGPMPRMSALPEISAPVAFDLVADPPDEVGADDEGYRTIPEPNIPPPALVDEDETPPPRPPPEDDGPGGSSWYTEEVELGTDTGFLPEDTLQAPLPEAEPDSGGDVIEALPGPPDDEPPSIEVTVLDPAEGSDSDDTTAGAPAAEPADPEAAPWVTSLRRFLEIVGPPPILDNLTDAAVEISRLEWAVGALTNPTEDWPTPVRFALVGLIATRARHTGATMGDMAAVADVVGRLDHYRRVHKLASVVALIGEHEPELASWHQDALQWWRALEDAFDH